MTKLASVVLCGVAGSASATPKPPLCVPGNSPPMMLVAVNGKAIACWEATGDCMSLDDNQAVSRPAPAKAAAEIRDDGGKPSACNAKTCKPLGKKLAAAVAKAKAQGERAIADNACCDRITVTTGLDVVAIIAPSAGDTPGFTELWNVASDKQLTPKQPAIYGGKDGAAMLVRVEAVGKLAFAYWTDCAGPCTKEIAVEPDGGNHSKAFEGGDTFALDNGTYLVAGENGTVTGLDSSGRHAGAVSFSGLGPDGSGPSGVAIASGEVVLVEAYMPDAKTKSFVHVKVASSGKPTLGKKAETPVCDP